MKKKTILLENGKVSGYMINLGNAPFLLIQARKGYVMCGYLNMNTANKLGDVAGKVTGVRTFDAVLNAEIVEVSENAKQMGLTVGMKGREFLNLLV